MFFHRAFFTNILRTCNFLIKRREKDEIFKANELICKKNNQPHNKINFITEINANELVTQSDRYRLYVSHDLEIVRYMYIIK